MNKLPILSGAQEELTYLCVGMIEMGYSIERTCDETGLTPWQVAYRRSLFGISTKDYRNGKSKLSKQILEDYIGKAEGIARQRAVKVMRKRRKEQREKAQKIVPFKFKPGKVETLSHGKTTRAYVRI
jgi:hypothetical protein